MKKVIGVLSVVVGVFVLLSDFLLIIVDGVGIVGAMVLMILGAASLFSGIKYIKPNPPATSSVSSTAPPQPASAPTPSRPAPPTERPHYSFKVAGTSFRKKEISKIAWRNDDYSLSKKALVDDGYIDERVYKYNPTTVTAELVPEPDNPHSSDAVKVVADGVHIGYVPNAKNKSVQKVLADKNIKEISCEIYGGDYKIVKEDEDGKYSLETIDNNFGAEVTIYYSEN